MARLNFIERNKNHYIKNENVSSEIINKYKDKLPDELLTIWETLGYGIFGDGYLKIVNPNDYKDLLEETYIPVHKDPIVMFATAMSDLIIWEITMLYCLIIDMENLKL